MTKIDSKKTFYLPYYGYYLIQLKKFIMSFIDYNFFPILFFLGWNILTTKQFRPTISNTSDSKTLPALSVFSLNNSMDQQTLESHSNHQKKSNILEFVPKFLFLSENQKLIGIPQTNITYSQKQIKDAYVLKKTLFKEHLTSVLFDDPQKEHDRVLDIQNTDTEMAKKQKILKICRKKTNNVNDVAKTTKWLPNGNKTHYFANHHLVNSNWKENFKSYAFNFTYRPKKKIFLSSFFPYNQKIKPVSPNMELWLNLGSMFSNMPLNVNSSKLVKSNKFKNDGIFFGGLCYSENTISFWKKAQKKLNSTFFKTGIFSPTSTFLKKSPFSTRVLDTQNTAAFFLINNKKNACFKEETNNLLKNQIKNRLVLKKDNFKQELSSTKNGEDLKKNEDNDYTCLFKGSFFLKIKTDKRKLNNINSIQKRRLRIRILLRAPNQKIYSLNQFQMALCFSKILQPPIFFHDNYRSNLAFFFSNLFEKKDTSKLGVFTNIGFPKFLIKNESQPQTIISKTEFLEVAPWNDIFKNSDRKSDYNYINKYNQEKKNWYMKTQFFQHIAWNMKYKILNRFSDVEYLVHKNHLFVKTSDCFVTKPFQLISYQNKERFPTNSTKSIKIEKEDLNIMSGPDTGETRNNNILMNSNSNKSIWLNDFSENPKRISPLKANTFFQTPPVVSSYFETQNSFLRIHGGSWYYENLAFPYSIFNTTVMTPSVIRQFEPISILNGWYKAPPFLEIKRGSRPSFLSKTRSVFYKVFTNGQKSIIEKEKLLESKRFALAWLYARKYNILQNLYYWPYTNKLHDNYAFFNKNQTQLELLPEKNKFEWNSIPLFDNQHPGFIDIKLGRFTALNNFNAVRLNNSYNYKKNPFFAKSQTKFKSDIGIYSLAHKLSSVGFRNGNSEIDIYPFKYNDSYRYNFQNMNVSNQRFKDFSSLSSLNNQTKNASVFDKKNPNAEQNYLETPKETRFSDCKKFLDFQNPIFSKTYAPLYQPKDLNLLSFIANSFLNIIPNSIIYSEPKTRFGSFHKKTETTNFSSLNERQSLINQYPYDLKKKNRPLKTIPFINESFHVTPKKWKMLNGLYNKLPINGIHANPYPWITQNAFDRWSASNFLWTFGSNSSLLRSFSKTKVDYPQINNLLKKKFALITNFNDSYKTSAFFNAGFLKNFNINALPSKTSVNTEHLMTSQKESLKPFNAQLHFTEKLSCIKKPSIFFSSFRHLPYFFISETLSKKNVVFPPANLSFFPFVNCPNLKLEKPTKNAYNDFSIPQYDLFQNSVLKENQKKQIRESLLPSFLQHKYFSLKPLSTFVKKEIGYQTSLFSWMSNTKNIYLENQTNDRSTLKKSVLMPKISRTYKKTFKFWSRSKKKSSQKMDLIPINQNTWRVFPPLFEPLTFRFNDLNLPRTWSSELLASIFNNKTDPPFVRKHSRDPLGPQTGKKGGTLNTKDFRFFNTLENMDIKKKPFGFYPMSSSSSSITQAEPHRFLDDKKRLSKHAMDNNVFWPKLSPQTLKCNVTQKNFFRFSIPFYFSDFFRFPTNENTLFNEKSTLFSNNGKNHENTGFYESPFPLTEFFKVDDYKQLRKNNLKFEKKNEGSMLNEAPTFQNSKIILYGEKPLLKNRTVNGPPLKNQKESISLPSYLKNITNQNYQNLCPNNLNEIYFVFWILFTKTLFIYLSLHYLRKFISFLGTEYIRNLFKIFVTMKFIDGNILSIIKTFQDFNFQLNQQNVIDIKVNKQLKNIKRNYK